ncbi:MAG: AAA family ATPase [Burkholderiales bacterium]|nr:AAA family ATPase [Burkholderiales bacterium]
METNPPPTNPPSPPPPEGKSDKALRQLLASGHPLLYVMSADELRAGRLLRHAAANFLGKPVPFWSWSLTEGLRTEDGTRTDTPSTDPRAALDFIAEQPSPALFQLKDFHEPLRDAADVRRRLRDLFVLCAERGQVIVVTAPVRQIPEELESNLLYTELTVPDFVEMKAFLLERAAAITAAGAWVDNRDTSLDLIIRAMLGLTLDEASFALRRAVATHGRLARECLPALLEEKRLRVNRSGTIEFIGDGQEIERIGGLEVMKKWLLERRALFHPRDDVGAELVPKGVLVMGVSGCGKSLSIKAIASSFELPLYRINMAEIFSGRHGTPEWAFARACRTMEEIAPAVVWFDEIEMSIASIESSGEQGRIFAHFLTWMQEKPRGVFVAATANRIDLLPAEMIRKGRFDEVFFVDLPHDAERIEIFQIHLERRGADPAKFDLNRLVALTRGWTGAEVEQCVVSAITRARIEDRELKFDDLMRTAARIVPLSKTMKEQVDHIRNWARDRAAPASLSA